MSVLTFQKLASELATFAGLLESLAPAMNPTARASATKRVEQSREVLRVANVAIADMQENPEGWRPVSTLPRWDGATADLWVFSQEKHEYLRIPNAEHKNGEWMKFVGNEWGWDEPIESRHQIIAWKPLPQGPKVKP